MAEGQGLEPWDLLQSAVFKTAAIRRYATLPKIKPGLFPGVTPMARHHDRLEEVLSVTDRHGWSLTLSSMDV